MPSSSLLLYAAPEEPLGQQVMWITHREGVSWDSINDDRLVAMFCEHALRLLFSLEEETHRT